ncbi:CRISPR-associated protein, TM1812 family [Thermoanaerobacter uzonensis DSM 18761]|uniref:CRISPR-associated protein, TM1812 family n=1 Tax=Thermoanaerobacter uzonensis DSM 18761 TaxID=1123369 RepID=A0A1M5AAI3_9THEO|nr:TIGR02221 family CRISPR-associated protein [Thermoanaerobacter uzonensis]SHF27330.1 CRISPR-associated protein, TM1812 family [Thermoanaerobacter uzonensis DSM 18761]
MTIKFFSFLGTGAYTKCKYKFDSIESGSSCYVQEALIDILLKNNVNLESIFIFKTEEATNANWFKNKKYPNDPGLKQVLDKYKGKLSINYVDIPSGQNENELWEIFDKVLEQIDKGDEIIFDITHSFRSIPILALIILNYAKFIRKCEIKGIYYGAIEAVGKEIKDIEESDIAPIFDLTPFVRLLDWTVGIDRFIETGDARHINYLMKLGTKELHLKGMKDERNILSDFAQKLEKYTKNVATCRGKEISKGGLELKNTLEYAVRIADKAYIKPMKPVIDRLNDRFKNFSDDENKNMLEIVKWCSEHSLIQQGFTILEEGIINFFCNKLGFDKNNKNQREIIENAIYIKHRSLPENKWRVIALKNKKVVDSILKTLNSENYQNLIRILYTEIKPLRNDINHAGYKDNPMNAKKFEDKLNELINKVEKYIV